MFDAPTLVHHLDLLRFFADVLAFVFKSALLYLLYRFACFVSQDILLLALDDGRFVALDDEDALRHYVCF